MMRFDVIVVGSSPGGLAALEVLLRDLPESLAVPVVAVQHRGKGDGPGLLAILQGYTALQVVEPEDKQRLLPGHFYLAPPDYHLLLENGTFALSIGAPVCFARPSIDVLFESAAFAYRDRVIAVVLTSSNDDGLRGVLAIEAVGGIVLIQDPATAESPVLPGHAVPATRSSILLPLEDIAPRLIEWVGCEKGQA
jgi:two-component system chemotaxis response regulator CheB